MRAALTSWNVHTRVRFREPVLHLCLNACPTRMWMPGDRYDPRYGRRKAWRASLLM
jgi:hypothetical protein